MSWACRRWRSCCTSGEAERSSPRTTLTGGTWRLGFGGGRCMVLGLRRGGKDADRLKGGLDGVGDLGLLALVGVGAGVENDEEGEEQGDEVGVGDQPAVVVRRGRRCGGIGETRISRRASPARLCRGCGGATALEAGELDFDHAGVHAFEDGDDAFEGHLFQALIFASALASACRRRGGRRGWRSRRRRWSRRRRRRCRGPPDPCDRDAA